jgi:hypothetical protein
MDSNRKYYKALRLVGHPWKNTLTMHGHVNIRYMYYFHKDFVFVMGMDRVACEVRNGFLKMAHLCVLRKVNCVAFR